MGRLLTGDRDGAEGKRSKSRSQSSTIIWREGRSPGFFSEKRRAESGLKGFGKAARNAVLPTWRQNPFPEDQVKPHLGSGKSLDTSEQFVEHLIIVLLFSSRQPIMSEPLNLPPLDIQQILQSVENKLVPSQANELSDPIRRFMSQQHPQLLASNHFHGEIGPLVSSQPFYEGLWLFAHRNPEAPTAGPSERRQASVGSARMVPVGT